MSTPDRRSDLLELFPIKLIGGFIAVDQHVGCKGCSFCLSRRHKLWPPIYEANWQYDGLFESPEQALALLNEMRPFRQACVPVRFGHNTDSVYQWDFGAELYRAMPENNPFIFMTRHAVPEKHIPLFQGQPNLLLKLTITPSSNVLDLHTDIDRLIEIANRIPPENLYVLIGPVAEDSYTAVPFIVDRLPIGCWIDVKPLTRSGIPGMECVNPIDKEIIATLRDSAFFRGMTVTDYFGCIFRRKMHRPFYKAGESPEYIQRSCKWCTQQELCYRNLRKEPRIDEMKHHASTIGITLGEATQLGHRIFHFECNQPTSRGDETFLSEITGNRIHLSSVPCGSEGGSFDRTPEEVLRRWEEYAMLPVSKLMPLAENVLDAWERERRS